MRIDLALLAMSRGDAADAEMMSSKAVEIGAEARAEADVRLNPWLWDARARVLLQAGQAQKAYDLAKQALEAERRYDDPASTAISGYDSTLRAATAALTKRT
jgi:tetratricopeptide (TPR) repeat protein